MLIKYEQDRFEFVELAKQTVNYDLTKTNSYTIMLNKNWISSKIGILSYLKDAFDIDLFLLICAKFSMNYKYVNKFSKTKIKNVGCIITLKEIKELILDKKEYKRDYKLNEISLKLKKSLKLFASCIEEIKVQEQDYFFYGLKPVFNKLCFIASTKQDGIEPFIYAEFSEELVSEVKGFNVLLNLNDVMSLKSKYAKIVYIILAENRTKGKATITKYDLMNKYLSTNDRHLKSGYITKKMLKGIDEVKNLNIVNSGAKLEYNLNNKQEIENIDFVFRLKDKVKVVNE